MSKEVKNPILQRVYDLDGDAERTREAYREWAGNYDRDTTEGMGYVAPGLAAAALAKRVGTGAVILDAGCGTGLAGAALHKLGVSTIDGNDLSVEMLDVAREKGVYRNLIEADMTGRLPYEDDTYDGILSIGVFTSGHVGPEGLDELARIARPDAPIIVTVHEKVWEKDKYPEYLRDMEARGLVRIRQITDSPYHEKEGLRCRLCVLRAQ